MTRDKGKRVIAFLIGVVLIALAVFLIIQAVWYGNLDHALQLEQNGFVKDDVTMLTYGQSAARWCCWGFGVVSALAGLGGVGIGLDIISL